MTVIYPRLRWSTGDGFLDLLACVYADAFDEAETDVGARADIIQMFDMDTLRALRAKGCITWDPDRVLVQGMLEVAL